MPSLVDAPAAASLEQDAPRRLRIRRRVEPLVAEPVQADPHPPAPDDDALPLDPAVLFALHAPRQHERAQPLLIAALTVTNGALAVYNLVTLIVYAR